MKYTELLNDEDIQYICKAISGKNFKKIFADSPKEFTRIKPGFRPNSMSDEEAVEIAIKNFNKEFVRGFVEVMIKQWLKEIEANFESLQMEDYDYEDAVALTLLDSYFAENVKLYFKLAQAEKDDAYILYIGGLFYPGSEKKQGKALSPAKSYMDDRNYMKSVLTCSECGWFGLEEEHVRKCPFCGNDKLELARNMLRPWGFAPKNARSIPDVQISEEYTAVQQPLYSTLPEADEIFNVKGTKNIRMASRKNQRIIMMNKGVENRGFVICRDCGAAMPGDDPHVLDDIQRPYITKFARGKCRHSDWENVNLGYDFVTDMLVLEFDIDRSRIDARRNDNPWLPRAAQSLAEALRLAASKYLDVEFSELVTGYRLRSNPVGTYVDVYLYDSLSSGAGYAVNVANEINTLLKLTREILTECSCSNACHDCLKHYRNQYVHGMLDRFAALELLDWGEYGKVTNDINLELQKRYLYPLKDILNLSGCKIRLDDSDIWVENSKRKKQVVVYPAMLVEPRDKEKIYVSDAYIKYAKPYAVQKILDEI